MATQFSKIQKKADALFNEAHYIVNVKNKSDYNKSLRLMDYLVDDYEKNKLLIEILSIAIEKWEDSAPEFSEFNQNIGKNNDAESIFKLLMEQHGLGVNDFPEIGSKSLISKIIHRERRLTRDHISALCNRFNISSDLFF